MLALFAGYFDSGGRKRKASSLTKNSTSASGGGNKPATFLSGQPHTMRVALLTISDRAHAGVYPDLSGPEMRRQLAEFPEDVSCWPSNLACTVTASAIVPDDVDLIRQQVLQWTGAGERGIVSSDEGTDVVDVVLTSGGTGFGVRDLTPEALRPILHREAPGTRFIYSIGGISFSYGWFLGVAQALLNEGLKHTPLAVLSRPIAGTIHRTFICTLPGSVKAVKENMQALRPLLPRIVELLVSGADSGSLHMG